jgi:hypothetical protein
MREDAGSVAVKNKANFRRSGAWYAPYKLEAIAPNEANWAVGAGAERSVRGTPSFAGGACLGSRPGHPTSSHPGPIVRNKANLGWFGVPPSGGSEKSSGAAGSTFCPREREKEGRTV